MDGEMCFPTLSVSFLSAVDAPARAAGPGLVESWPGSAGFGPGVMGGFQRYVNQDSRSQKKQQGKQIHCIHGW